MVNAYPVAGKRKSFDICHAFISGCGGSIVTDGLLRPGPAFFYGVDRSNEEAWHEVRAHGVDYWYSDNSYFDKTRGTHFRVTRNALQHNGHGTSDCRRFRKLGIPMQLWRNSGEHIVLAPQSSHFMHVVCGIRDDWIALTLAALKNFTARPARVRAWTPDKAALSGSLDDDLERAHSLVTWSSAAAVSAVLAGVPIVTTGPSAASPMAGDIADIECLPRPERDAWAGVLADNQWTLDEFRDGTVWSVLNA